MVATRADLSALLACEHDAIPAQELDRRLDVVRQIRQTLPLRGMWTPAAGLTPTRYHTQRVCCDDCRRSMLNARARARRRVRHEQIDCAVCGELFTPKRKDAGDLQQQMPPETSPPAGTIIWIWKRARTCPSFTDC